MKNNTEQLLPFNFEILDSVKPSINGKDTYQRLLIRRVPATGEKVVSICKICETWMTENGKEKDLNECDRCELRVVFSVPVGHEEKIFNFQEPPDNWRPE